MSYILTKACSFQLQEFLIMYQLLVDKGVKGLIIQTLFLTEMSFHIMCCNTNTRPSFSNTWSSFLNTRLSFPNSWPSFWFSFKASKDRPRVWKTQPSVWKPRPRVLKQVLDQVFYYRELMKIWSVKSTVYLLESSVINFFPVHLISNTCTYSLRH